MKRTSMLDKAGRDFAETGKPKPQVVLQEKGGGAQPLRQPMFLRLASTTIAKAKHLSADRRAAGRQDWHLHDLAEEAFNLLFEAEERKKAS